ncbi:hypothetical protein K2173_006624 [Erythroxylum novogranatense]|uniref:Uncharacterized protein n=1 Tax=Erythroxylum novogranatense TaxID=1862640 RepID=A0AAV8T5G3_9ROSI|nr:hypothetical protein K2173_006624 [Erythroxylum novogranatense]
MHLSRTLQHFKTRVEKVPRDFAHTPLARGSTWILEKAFPVLLLGHLYFCCTKKTRIDSHPSPCLFCFFPNSLRKKIDFHKLTYWFLAFAFWALSVSQKGNLVSLKKTAVKEYVIWTQESFVPLSFSFNT